MSSLPDFVVKIPQGATLDLKEEPLEWEEQALRKVVRSGEFEKLSDDSNTSFEDENSLQELPDSSLKHRSLKFEKSRKTNECSFCLEKFPNKFDLNQHVLQAHNQIKAKICEICQATFLGRSELVQHVRRAHRPDRAFRACHYCSALFESSKDLRFHIDAVHKNLRPYGCNLCPKRFHQNCQLIVHVKSVHENLRSFACNSCQDCFTTKQSLRSHQENVHKNWRPFQCDFCCKQFGQLINLKTHVLRLHTKKKNFECEDCDSRFSSKSDLSRHKLIVHERSFQCHLCQQAFGQKSVLKFHIESVHEGLKPFQCQVCKRDFGARSSLTRHQRRKMKCKVVAANTVDKTTTQNKCSEKNRNSKRALLKQKVASNSKSDSSCDPVSSDSELATRKRRAESKRTFKKKKVKKLKSKTKQKSCFKTLKVDIDQEPEAPSSSIISLEPTFSNNQDEVHVSSNKPLRTGKTKVKSFGRTVQVVSIIIDTVPKSLNNQERLNVLSNESLLGQEQEEANFTVPANKNRTKLPLQNEIQFSTMSSPVFAENKHILNLPSLHSESQSIEQDFMSSSCEQNSFSPKPENIKTEELVVPEKSEPLSKLKFGVCKSSSKADTVSKSISVRTFRTGNRKIDYNELEVVALNSDIHCTSIVVNNTQAFVKKKSVKSRFKCKFCEKTFTQKINLLTHCDQVHYDLKIFRCHFCPARSFALECDLTRHISISHEKKFHCQICSKNFGQKSVLQTHLKTVHLNVRDFSCAFCGHEFGTNYSLKRHVATKHKTKVLQQCDPMLLPDLKPQTDPLIIDKISYNLDNLKTEKYTEEFQPEYNFCDEIDIKFERLDNEEDECDDQIKMTEMTF